MRNVHPLLIVVPTAVRMYSIMLSFSVRVLCILYLPVCYDCLVSPLSSTMRSPSATSAEAARRQVAESQFASPGAVRRRPAAPSPAASSASARPSGEPCTSTTAAVTSAASATSSTTATAPAVPSSAAPTDAEDESALSAAAAAGAGQAGVGGRSAGVDQLCREFRTDGGTHQSLCRRPAGVTASGDVTGGVTEGVIRLRSPLWAPTSACCDLLVRVILSTY